MPAPSVSLMADSVTRAGDRLCTVLARGLPDADVVALEQRPGWTVTCTAGVAVITGGAPDRWPGGLGTSLDVLAGWPAVAGVDGLHAPFLADCERDGVDLATRAALAVSRAAAGGHSAGGQRADLARYARLADGPAAGRSVFHHAALPADHCVIRRHEQRCGVPVPAGRYPGWVSWGELLDWRGNGRPLADPTREGV